MHQVAAIQSQSAREPTMTGTHYNVLFLCTGNSARSIMAEAILNHKAKGTFTAYSAGSHPSGAARPEAIKQLQLAGIATNGLRSKSWDEFAAPNAPPINFIFTVCDNAANEVCPIWPGHPMTAHWGVPDPAAVKGPPETIERAFQRRILHSRPQNKPLSFSPTFSSRTACSPEGDR